MFQLEQLSIGFTTQSYFVRSFGQGHDIFNYTIMSDGIAFRHREYEGIT